MAKAGARPLEVENLVFFKMHTIPCDYEKRDPADILPLEEVREGLKHLSMRLSTFHDRPPASMPSAGGNSAFANGTGAASFVKHGQIMTPIKLLYRLSQEESSVDSPVFFFAYRNYDRKLSDRRLEIHDECMAIKDRREQKVSHLLEVTIGGLFILKSKYGDEFIRIRVCKISLEKEERTPIQYWAVDEAFFGNCHPSDLLFINGDLADMNMLAVPGIFETDPTPAQLTKLEGPGHPYCMARLSQPKYSCDFGPRKISLL